MGRRRGSWSRGRAPSQQCSSHEGAIPRASSWRALCMVSRRDRPLGHDNRANARPFVTTTCSLVTHGGCRVCRDDCVLRRHGEGGARRATLGARPVPRLSRRQEPRARGREQEEGERLRRSHRARPQRAPRAWCAPTATPRSSPRPPPARASRHLPRLPRRQLRREERRDVRRHHQGVRGQRSQGQGREVPLHPLPRRAHVPARRHPAADLRAQQGLPALPRLGHAVRQDGPEEAAGSRQGPRVAAQPRLALADRALPRVPHRLRSEELAPRPRQEVRRQEVRGVPLAEPRPAHAPLQPHARGRGEGARVPQRDDHQPRLRDRRHAQPALDFWLLIIGGTFAGVSGHGALRILFGQLRKRRGKGGHG